MSLEEIDLKIDKLETLRYNSLLCLRESPTSKVLVESINRMNASINLQVVKYYLTKTKSEKKVCQI